MRKRIAVSVAVLGLAAAVWVSSDDAPRSESATRTARSGPTAPESATALATTHSPRPTVARASATPGAITRSPVAADLMTPARGCADDGFTDCTFLEPTPDDLEEMARCGIVRYELPGDFGGRTGDAWWESADLSTDERAAVDAAVERVNTEHRSALERLAVDAGMDAQWASASSAFLLWGTLEQELDPDAFAHAARTLASARRDGTPPRLSDDVAARTLALMGGWGNALEAAVAEQLGPSKARALHGLSDGWPGLRRNTRSQCVDADPSVDAVDPLVPQTEEEARRCLADFEGEGCAFLNPDPRTAELMARCGVVRTELPTFAMTRTAEPGFDEEWAKSVSLTDAERDAIAVAGERARDALYEALTAAAVDIGGKEPSWAEQSPLLALFKAALEDSDDAASLAVAAQIARERAGAPRSAVADVPPALEAMQRAIVDFGEDFEAALAESIGLERARALRSHADGWPGNRTQSRSQCSDD